MAGPLPQHPLPACPSMALHCPGHVSLLSVICAFLAWSTTPVFPHGVPPVCEVLCPRPMSRFQAADQQHDSEEAQRSLVEPPQTGPSIPVTSALHGSPFHLHSPYPSSQVNCTWEILLSLCLHFWTVSQIKAGHLPQDTISPTVSPAPSPAPLRAHKYWKNE